MISLTYITHFILIYIPLPSFLCLLSFIIISIILTTLLPIIWNILLFILNGCIPSFNISFIPVFYPFGIHLNHSLFGPYSTLWYTLITFSHLKVIYITLNNTPYYLYYFFHFNILYTLYQIGLEPIYLRF